MKKILYLKIPITVVNTLILVLIVLDWIFGKTVPNLWVCVGIGIIFGIIIALLVHNIESQDPKEIAHLEDILLIFCAFLVFYSNFVPEASGIAGGFVIPVILRRVIYQFHKKKVIT